MALYEDRLNGCQNLLEEICIQLLKEFPRQLLLKQTFSSCAPFAPVVCRWRGTRRWTWGSWVRLSLAASTACRRRWMSSLRVGGMPYCCRTRSMVYCSKRWVKSCPPSLLLPVEMKSMFNLVLKQDEGCAPDVTPFPCVLLVNVSEVFLRLHYPKPSNLNTHWGQTTEPGEKHGTCIKIQKVITRVPTFSKQWISMIFYEFSNHLTV